MTLHQKIIAAAYGDGDRYPTQAQLATRFHCSQPAICGTLKRFEEKLTPEQLKRYQRRTRRGYKRALQQNGKRIRLSPMQLSLVRV